MLPPHPPLSRRTSYYTDEQVVEMRRAYRGGGITQKQIAEKYGGNTRTVSAAMVGKTFAHIDGVIPPNEVTRNRRSKLTDEQALFIRLQYAGLPSASLVKLSRTYGTTVWTIRNVLLGVSHRNVPGALTRLRPNSCRKLTDDQARDVRRRYGTRYVSIPALAREFGITQHAMQRIVRGYAYKDLPHAVPDQIKAIHPRLRKSL